MATSDTDTFKQLLKAIQEMNKNLESATFAINNMTMQINSSGASITVDPTLLREVNCSKEAQKVIDATNATNANDMLGYINWDKSHDILKSQHLVKMSHIRQSLEKLTNCEIKSTTPVTVKQNSRAIAQSDQWGNPISTVPTLSGCFNFSTHLKPLVDKETRFPLDAVYVDVESPRVKGEIKFMNEINVLPTQGVIDRFLRIIESEKHSCASFENKYGLKWL